MPESMLIQWRRLWRSKYRGQKRCWRRWR